MEYQQIIAATERQFVDEERDIELARGLLSDSQTRVIYQQASNELRAMRDLLQLTDTEVSAVGSLAPGTGLWKVGQRSFVVQHLISEAEQFVVDTEPAERPRPGRTR